MDFYKKATEYLISCNIRVNPGFIREKMESHPNYPALISFTDTLDEIGIQYDALEVLPEYLFELNHPLLVHFKDQGNEYFDIIKNLKDTNFLKLISENKWDGVVLSIHKGQRAKNSMYERTLIKNVNAQRLIITLIFLLILFLAIKSYLYHGAFGEILFIINSIGFIISLSILMYKIGKTNSISNTLCSNENNTKCDKVLNSGFGQISNWMGLGELSSSFFLTIIIAISILDVDTNNLKSLIAFPFFTGMIFTFITAFQQAFIIKSWCKMCIIVSVIIWINFFLLISKFGTSFKVNIDSLLFLLLIIPVFGFSFLLILLAKKIITQLDFAIENKISYLKWKRDPSVFSSLILNSRKINYEGWDNEIVIGDIEAKIIILVVCNPYCSPCAKAHLEMERLITDFPKQVKIIIRFSIEKVDINDRKVIAINQILFAETIYNAKSNKPNQRPIDFWFKNMQLEKFNSELALDSQEINIELIMKHAKWSTSVKIEFTPTIFINGCELPSKYNFKDIREFIPYLIEKYSSESVVYNTGFNGSMAMQV